MLAGRENEGVEGGRVRRFRDKERRTLRTKRNKTVRRLKRRDLNMIICQSISCVRVSVKEKDHFNLPADTVDVPVDTDLIGQTTCHIGVGDLRWVKISSWDEGKDLEPGSCDTSGRGEALEGNLADGIRMVVFADAGCEVNSQSASRSRKRNER